MLSKDCRRILQKCLTYDPEKRPAAKQLLQHPFVLGVAGTSLLEANVLYALGPAGGDPSSTTTRRQGEDSSMDHHVGQGTNKDRGRGSRRVGPMFGPGGALGNLGLGTMGVLLRGLVGEGGGSSAPHAMQEEDGSPDIQRSRFRRDESGSSSSSVGGAGGAPQRSSGAGGGATTRRGDSFGLRAIPEQQHAGGTQQPVPALVQSAGSDSYLNRSDTYLSQTGEELMKGGSNQQHFRRGLPVDLLFRPRFFGTFFLSPEQKPRRTTLLGNDYDFDDPYNLAGSGNGYGLSSPSDEHQAKAGFGAAPVAGGPPSGFSAAAGDEPGGVASGPRKKRPAYRSANSDLRLAQTVSLHHRLRRGCQIFIRFKPLAEREYRRFAYAPTIKHSRTFCLVLWCVYILAIAVNEFGRNGDRPGTGNAVWFYTAVGLFICVVFTIYLEFFLRQRRWRNLVDAEDRERYGDYVFFTLAWIFIVHVGLGYHALDAVFGDGWATGEALTIDLAEDAVRGKSAASTLLNAEEKLERSSRPFEGGIGLQSLACICVGLYLPISPVFFLLLILLVVPIFVVGNLLPGLPPGVSPGLLGYLATQLAAML